MSDLPSINYTLALPEWMPRGTDGVKAEPLRVPPYGLTAPGHARRVLIRARREECASARAVRAALVRACLRGDWARRRVMWPVLRESLWAEVACVGALLAVWLWR